MEQATKDQVAGDIPKKGKRGDEGGENKNVS